jgi:flagellar FliL protein
MSDHEADAAKPKKKSKLPLLIGLGALLLVGGGGAAVFFLAPLVVAGQAAKAGAASAAHEPEKKASSSEDKVLGTVAIEPVVVDVRSEDGEVHHLRVSLSLELAEGQDSKEFQSYVPRAREAAIAYLRAQSFEDLVAADRFEAVRQELSKRLLAAVGEQRATRVLVTDYVSQ